MPQQAAISDVADVLSVLTKFCVSVNSECLQQDLLDSTACNLQKQAEATLLVCKAQTAEAPSSWTAACLETSV